MQRRIPKFGFKRPQKVVLKPVNLDTIQQLCDTLKTGSIDPELLINNGIVNKKDIVKVLGRGELKTKVDVSAHYFSEKAAKMIEEKGGKITKLAK